MVNLLCTVALSLLLLKAAAQWILDFLNAQHVRKHADRVPAEFAEVMDEETYGKSVRYTLDKSRFSQVSELFDAGVLAVLLATPFLAWFFGGLTGVLGTSIWGQALVLFVMGLALSLPGLPFEWWNQFRLEEKHGFNKSSVGLWLSDKAKGLAIGLLLGYPLLLALLKIFEVLGSIWWLWAFLLFFGFQLVMFLAYPIWIMPLFNKFEDLPEGSLRDRLLALGDRTGFKAKTIQVMDGSKRSGHSNAFFTGLGKFRRIVLFDTLVEQLTEEELEGVLAHEIGHYKCGHIPKMLLVSALGSLAMFAVLGWLSQAAWFVEGFHFAAGSGMVPVLLMFSLLSGLLTFWLTPMSSIFSRKHEYEADAFARDAQGTAEHLIGALHKLNEKNLSNLTPHPWYSRFYYSHPTLLERQQAMLSGKS